MSTLRKNFGISSILKNKKILCIPFDRSVDVLCILLLKLIILMQIMAGALIVHPMLILLSG